MSSQYRFLPAPQLPAMDDSERLRRAEDYYRKMSLRRTIRHFSERPVERRVIEQCLLAAGTAPNGANLQPWHFCAVADMAVKHQIRSAAEAEEREFYQTRATGEWLADLAPLGTDADKPFLEVAPWLIVVFARIWRPDPDGGSRHRKNYYVSESVGIATGFLISALHECGLATLTHTPSPMKFLNTILGRPDNERPFLILVTGHAAAGATVPDITKLSLENLATFY